MWKFPCQTWQIRHLREGFASQQWIWLDLWCCDPGWFFLKSTCYILSFSPVLSQLNLCQSNVLMFTLCWGCGQPGQQLPSQPLDGQTGHREAEEVRGGEYIASYFIALRWTHHISRHPRSPTSIYGEYRGYIFLHWKSSPPSISSMKTVGFSKRSPVIHLCVHIIIVHFSSEGEVSL